MTDETPESTTAAKRETPPRRSFLKRGLAVAIGGVVAIFPALAGIAFFADPLRKRNHAFPGGAEPQPEGIPAGFFKVAALDAVPQDGSPQLFRVIADRMDAWTYFPKSPIGSVMLRRKKDGSVAAYNSTCPHAGCAIDYRPAEGNYYCPCHNSRFTLDGARSDDSPSPRDLDELESIVQGGSVWVKYQEFRAGEPERIEVT